MRSLQASPARLERHELSLPSPTCNSGAHVVTVSAMYWPFLIGSVRVSGNCATVPKYGLSVTRVAFATTRRLSFLPGSSTTIVACESSPKRS